MFLRSIRSVALVPLIVMMTSAGCDESDTVRLTVSPSFPVKRRRVNADLSNWSWARELPGGILEDLLPHPLTVARALANQELQLIQKHVFRSGRLPFLLDDEIRLIVDLSLGHYLECRARPATSG
jgi:hypothetical protein